MLERAKSNFIADVSAYYQAHQSWAGVGEYFRQRTQPPQVGAGRPEPPPSAFALADLQGVVVIPGRAFLPGARVSAAELQNGTPLEIDGQIVGTVLATGAVPDLDPREAQYLERTNLALFASAISAAMIAILMGVVLARVLTKPVSELTAALGAMARGDLQQQLPVRSRDELGELTRAFNRMSADLARANQLRRQMTEDIAHDLRTPLTVIGGYVESLREGVLEPTPARLDAMRQEVQHLQRLVEDLRTLSLADAGELKFNRQRVAPRDLIEQAASAFLQQAAQQRFALQTQSDAALPAISVDVDRIAQVLGNLISNALRYTPAGGRIVLSAKQTDGVVLYVEDNGAGIAPEVLPNIFERFYRGDASRRNESESGLGLAIARSLVEAHGGKIAAASEGVGRGSVIAVWLPV